MQPLYRRKKKQGPNCPMPFSKITKRNYIVLFGAPDSKEFPKLNNKKRQTKETSGNHDNQFTLSKETVTILKDELQSLLEATEEKIQKKVENQCTYIELKLDATLQTTLIEFKSTILSVVEIMTSIQITNQITKQMQLINANMSTLMSQQMSKRFRPSPSTDIPSHTQIEIYTQNPEITTNEAIIIPTKESLNTDKK